MLRVGRVESGVIHNGVHVDAGEVASTSTTTQARFHTNAVNINTTMVRDFMGTAAYFILPILPPVSYCLLYHASS
eukprot:4264978-Prymnesium_polylepis.1